MNNVLGDGKSKKTILEKCLKLNGLEEVVPLSWLALEKNLTNWIREQREKG